MTAARALHSVLKGDYSLEEKLEVVSNVTKSEKLKFAYKHEIVIDWLIDCIENHNYDSSNGILLWSTFHDVLENLLSKEKDQIAHLKPRYLKIFIETLKNSTCLDNCIVVIFKCLSLFLQSSVNSIIVFESDILLNLLFVNLEAFCKLFIQNSEYLKESKHRVSLILDLLDKSPHIYDESKILTFVNSLQELASFIYFASKVEDFQSLCNRLVLKFTGLIFHPKTRLYETLLTRVNENQVEKVPNENIMAFYLTLQKLLKKKKMYEDISGFMVCSTLMKKMMTCILEQKQRRSPMEPLTILALFCATLGLDIPILITANSCCNDILKLKISNISTILLPLSELLEACDSHPEYFLLSSVPENYLKPVDWLEGVLAVLLDIKTGCDRSILLKCFRSLLKLSVSLVENNVAPLIRLCLLNFHLEAKQEYCGYFNDLISVYAQLHQLPKFFVKLLLALTECVKENIAGDLINNGQLFREIQQSLAIHFEGISFGETLELWKIFAETFTTFGNMNQIFSSGKGALFLVTQIFTIFLLHAKLFDAVIPTSIYEKFGHWIEYTSKELEENIFVLTEESKEVRYFQRSFLLLCFALGEVKLAYNYCSDDPLNDSLTLKFPDNLFDCSLLHPFLTEDHTKVFHIFLEGDDKILSFLVFQLMVQKIKGLLAKKELSEEENSHLKFAISSLIEHVQRNSSSYTPWDLDLSTLDNNNYGSAIWRIFLKMIVLVMKNLGHKQLLATCSCIHDIVLNRPKNSDDNCLDNIILSSLKSNYYFESKDFQSAFVASLWKFDSVLLHRKRSSDEMDSEEISHIDILMKLSGFRSKWIKYAETTPKSKIEEGLNPLWSNLQEACTFLNQLLLNNSVSTTKLKLQLQNKIELINCLPLEYLLPGNQMQCVVGLSVLFFLIPDICKKSEVVKTAEHVATNLVKILDGVRSIWLFDFVSSGPYLREIVNTITKIMEKNGDEEIWSWAKLLLQHIIKQISKNPTTFSAIEYHLAQQEKGLENQNNTVEVLSLLLILQKISQLYHRVHLSPDLKETCHKIFNLGGRCFLKYLKMYQNNEDENILKILLSCYITMIEVMNCHACPVEPKIQSMCLEAVPNILSFSKEKLTDNSVEHETYLKSITKMCNLSQELSNYLPEDFCISAWDSILLHLQNKKFESLEDVESTEKSDSDHSCTMCCSLPTNAIALSTVAIQEHETEALKSACQIMPPELLNKMFEKVSNKMLSLEISTLEANPFQVNLIVLKHLIQAFIDKSTPLPSESLINLLFHLNYLVNELCQSDFYLLMVKIPIMQLLHFIVQKRASDLPRQSLVHCLHSCLGVKFNSLTKNQPSFTKAFNAAWNIVYSLLICHPTIVLSIRPAYLSFVTMLLKSIVRVGSQDNILTSDKQQLLVCAQNMERLLTGLARHDTELSKLVPYLIADYVDSVQHVTLESNVKAHLISGINRLLGLCSEDSLKMLAVNINHSCRDIYSNLVKNYKQNKFRGAV